jgi:hypothetical protein
VKLNTAISVVFAAASLFAVSAEARDTSCVLTNGRTLALTRLDTRPTYTYGQADKSEMTLSGPASGSQVYKAEPMFSGGGAIYVRFTHGAYSYVAYSGIGRGWNFEGLLVYKSRKLVMHKECKDAGKLLAGVSASDINAQEDAAGDFIGPP